ncbi:Outer membrane receptor proteins, mostly Fe transport [Cnuella takakiae]|uniref:Outer membrane receptor proteins, mostly Fe transport n=1 Tax=Cnuella takakiae TaxID=1302690 RepID=A0A1M5DVM3_9BACT|nr:TonB-dependent receptor [Cnuella takakiae]OLY93854.1 TonB-dependent receptor [Cnuella takakiae]SHF70872.1 Outer membrane receptor proteins, mostly Fe transport [Cnuella takakiae]
MRSLWILLVALFFAPVLFAQTGTVSLSGMVRDNAGRQPLAFVSITLRKSDSSLVAGTISGEDGRFQLPGVVAGEYLLQLSHAGYTPGWQKLLVGRLSAYLELGIINLAPMAATLSELRVAARQEGPNSRMDRQVFSIQNNISQAGGSVLQAMRNLPGITVSEGGKVQLRGSDRVVVLLDGRQTALTGFGNQAALDNIPASAIERVEIINNPSAKYDANGAAGIINIIYKKSGQQGFNGKLGMTTGLGALLQKKENLPSIRPQYQATPKFNPSLSLNYRKNRFNAFMQGDYLYNKTLNKNDFTTRYYSNGDTIRNQVKRNRITTVGTIKAGVDWQLSDADAVSVSGLYSSEYVRDHGDIPYFNDKLTNRSRLWQFYEDEVNTAATVSANYQHRFQQPGHLLQVMFNYTFHREDEQYFLTDIRPAYTGRDTFMLLADEHVSDLSIDYFRPLKQGRFEGGFKFRQRNIPTNMRFFPGINSPLDTNAAGWARYQETIPALFGNYVYEQKRFELEAGLRWEYVHLSYRVNPDHNTYKSDGYNYVQPFPSVRMGYKLGDQTKLSLYYNRRVDRPDEGDIRIFPKYDDPEILKVGNPALQPQFTNSVEAGLRKELPKGYLYTAVYFRTTNGTITRIGTNLPGSTIIYSVFQNAGRSYNGGIEMLWQHNAGQSFTYNINANLYRNRIAAFSIANKYPVPTLYDAPAEEATSGSVKFNGVFHLRGKTDLQLTAVYLAPDIIPQGKVYARFSLDMGLKKSVQQGNGELFANATDLFNTYRLRKEIKGSNFHFVSTDYYETQVFRTGYAYKF